MSGPKRRGVTRRETLGFVGGATISLAAGPVLAKTLLKGTGPFGAQAERHGLSIFGDLKYGPDFTHFDYVNPDAPKGGKLALQPGSWLHNQNPQTFNTLNGYVTKGDAPPRLELIFDTLMVSAYDEPDAIYGLLDESVQVSEDGNSFLFRLRPEARFHDGSRLTAYDAAFSISILKQDGHPDFTQSYKKISKIEALSNTHLLIELDGTQSRALILEMAANAPIFSQKFYETQDFSASSLTPPLASGPYKIGRFEQGRYLEYERVEDYWAKDLPIAEGHANFDVIRVDFFRERQTGFEAFKKGEVTFREEFTSKTWATEYEFPAVTDGRVKKMLFPSEKRPSFQGNFINARRSKFADVRTREALGLCFDFEWVNQNLFFGAYA
ncbi:MAG: ABC transporter substrate-binding protein, partial [Rhizobiales bacterium]|nr:ABC transporter substrate-binding protein [Hyphomicrobiales bacterium]